jgi:hypothetical protein
MVSAMAAAIADSASGLVDRTALDDTMTKANEYGKAHDIPWQSFAVPLPDAGHAPLEPPRKPPIEKEAP